MRARHTGRPVSRGRLRWVATALGAAVAGVAIFATTTPAHASATTTDAQLSLSGVATKSSVLGGSLIGIHPGDTVDFMSSGLPTAGLDNIPALGSLVQNLLSPLLGQFQVVLHTGANFPGGARNVTLGGPTSGPCKGAKDLAITFPSIGTYNFTWNVQYVLPGLLGCATNGLSNSDLNLLKGAGVALNASEQWVGQVVAANDPPKGGIGLQLPGIKIAPSLPVVGQLPTLGVTLPVVQLPVTLPTLPGLPGGGGAGGGNGGGGSGGGGLGGGGGGLCVPCVVMTNPGGGGAPAPDANSVTQIGRGLTDPGPVSGSDASSSGGPHAAPAPKTSKHVDLAANKAPAAQMPVILAIIAIIALSLVTATYARLFLLRRN
ncbi:MAG TPA: hypothetical protein VGN35_07695 [Jatrophihabitantaceae bacterium]|nr:hypothetical protein [Jatrophihabitantaceae bacterium]